LREEEKGRVEKRGFYEMRKIRHPGNAKLVVAMVITMILMIGNYVFSWSSQEDKMSLKTTSIITVIGKEKNHGDRITFQKSFWENNEIAQVVKRTESLAKGPKKQSPDSPKQSEIWREPVTGMEFVWIPGGCFKMGSSPDEVGRDPDEGPVHDVCLDDFWMQKTEVTNAQYRKFEFNYESPSYRGHSMNGDHKPVIAITWYEAKAFATWLTEQNKGRYQFRLPTEAEWEYATRAGTTTSRFWGNDPKETCRYANVGDLTGKREWSYWKVHDCDDGYEVTAPVGSFAANPFGLYDMLGNVFEWLEDVYSADAYSYHSVKNPVYTGIGLQRVIRGGCWYSWPDGVRSAGRSDHPAQGGKRGRNKDYFIGFRLVRSP
jgi:sulfatase modifying factor 1